MKIPSARMHRGFDFCCVAQQTTYTIMSQLPRDISIKKEVATSWSRRAGRRLRKLYGCPCRGARKP